MGKDRGKKVREALGAWNDFVQGLVAAEKAWKKFSWIITQREVGLEDFPVAAQKILSRMSPRSEIDVILERLSSAYREHRGFEFMFVEVPEEEKKELEGEKE